MVDEFAESLKEYERKRKEERKEFMKKCVSKITDEELIYHFLGLGLCERFNLELGYNGSPPSVVWDIVNYYVENVDEKWTEWLTKDDAPLIRPISQVKKIFPELAIIKDDKEEIVDLANKLYNLDIKTDYDCVWGRSEYFYAYSFDFNSFEPLPVAKIKKLKNERKILMKYDVDVSELDKKLSSFGLSEKELEAI